MSRALRRIVTAAVVLVVAAGLYFLLALLFAGRPGYGVPELGRAHTDQNVSGCSPAFNQYNSRPPTSGCHDPGTTSYTIHDQPINDQVQVHNLEHGAVIIQYHTSGITGEDDSLVRDLTALVNRLKDKSPTKYCRLMLAPYAIGFAAPTVSVLASSTGNMKIALTAWDRIDLLESYDEMRITNFIDAFINQGPESAEANDCNP
ncbi:DUF3105 domain-containing protein [Candidatus Acetothermia bacterium]|nr:DUF3105 domain-containing protein [Candidatus Acetothermia bacterium]MBI3642574.1 DUF3105 domain-containing protein [Candidatus Acetothermia bacterium]